MSVLGLIGTRKAGFPLRGKRTSLELGEPIFKGWRITAAGRAPDGTYLVGSSSDIYGPAVHRSSDFEDWQQVVEGPAWPEGSDHKLKNIWFFKVVGESVYLGVDDAGLFVSENNGNSWSPVKGLNEHPTRSGWYPGAGGMCAHVLLTADGGRRLWCGISAVGMFRSDDGGETWEPKNQGVEKTVDDETIDEIGFCIHGIVADPDDPDLIYRQDHQGVYRTTNGGDSWERIENGLPARFGFPIAIDARTRALFVIPQESDEYRMTPNRRLGVYRSRDGGDSWRLLDAGLPQEGVYTGVLRGSMAVDGLDPGGIYFGTTAGTFHSSVDGGETWISHPWTLPRITSVDIFEAG
jgi:photosystem II stability/assembly factor-like uncharacterized protein